MRADTKGAKIPVLAFQGGKGDEKAKPITDVEAGATTAPTAAPQQAEAMKATAV